MTPSKRTDEEVKAQHDADIFRAKRILSRVNMSEIMKSLLIESLACDYDILRKTTELQTARKCAEIAENWRSQDNMFEYNGKKTCGDFSHDSRWCGHCESKNDGAESVSHVIRTHFGIKEEASDEQG